MTLGYFKLGHIVDAECAILNKFLPFWKPFKPFIRELPVAFFPISPISGSHMGHIIPKKMVDISMNNVEGMDAGTVDLAPDIASYNVTVFERLLNT